jgi:O-antigen/teichoic acid export membrane protein
MAKEADGSPTPMRRVIARNIFSNYVAFGVTSLITLILIPFLIDKLTPEQFGVWILLKSILGYFQLLELGLIPAVVRFSSMHHSRGETALVEDVLGAAMRMLGTLSLAAIPIIAVVAWAGPRLFSLEPHLAPLFTKSVWLLCIAVMVSYYRRLMLATLRGYQRYDLLNACSVTSALLGAAATFYFVARGHGIPTMIVILIVRHAAEASIELLLIRRKFGIRPSPFRFSKDAIRKIKEYSKFAFFIDLAVAVSHRIDVLVIGLFLPISAITHFEIGSRISGTLEKVTGPLVGMIFPMASGLDSANKSEELRRLLLNGTRATMAMITPGLLMAAVYGKDIIGWWVGGEFVDAAWPVLIVFLGSVFTSVFDSTSARILLGTGRVRFDAKISAAMALCNITLSLILVRPFGIVGVAIGTLIPQYLGICSCRSRIHAGSRGLRSSGSTRRSCSLRWRLPFWAWQSCNSAMRSSTAGSSISWPMGR